MLYIKCRICQNLASVLALFLVFLNESLDVAGPDINGVVHVCFGGKSHVHGLVAGNTADPQPEGVIDVVEIDVESGSDILAFVLLEIGPGQILPFGGHSRRPGSSCRRMNSLST